MKVAHVRDRTFTVFIGRPSVFGNPFIVGVHGTRKQCIKQFEQYVWKSQRVLDAIRALKRNAILGCYCTPKPCHGTVIIAVYKSLTRHIKDNAADQTTEVSRVSRRSHAHKNLRHLSRKR
jgi:hypothetical protein